MQVCKHVQPCQQQQSLLALLTLQLEGAAMPSGDMTSPFVQGIEIEHVPGLQIAATYMLQSSQA